MRNPVIDPSLLAVNAEVSLIHTEGLTASLRGQFDQAHVAFADAHDALASVPPTIDSAVQLGRIVRDEGFTYTREALANEDVTLLDIAANETKKSLSIVDRADRAGKIGDLDFATPGDLEGKLGEINAEQAATLGVLGRIATARTVLTGAHTETAAYEESHAFATRGSNGYYRVSNAVNAARHERVSGQTGRVLRWLGRAASGLVWTAAKDRANLRQAVLTTGDRVLHLRSKKAAIASVHKRP